MEDCPHHFWIVNSAEVVADVQTEDYLVKLCFFDPDALIAKWRWQFSQEVRQSYCTHVEFTHWIVFCPGILERLDVFLLQRQDVIFIFSCLVVVEALANNCDKDVHENEECYQLEHDPEDNCDDSLVIVAVVHDAVPRVSGACLPKRHK